MMFAKFQKKHWKMAKRIIDAHTEHWGRAWQAHLQEVFLHPGSGKYALLPYSVIDAKGGRTPDFGRGDLQVGKAGARLGGIANRKRTGRGAAAGENIAAVFVLRLEVEAMVLYFLSVGSDYQGKGIGSAVIEFAAKEGRKAGAKFLRLDTYAKFGKALSFYKKMGFRVCGRVKYFNEDNDEQIFVYKKIR